MKMEKALVPYLSITITITITVTITTVIITTVIIISARDSGGDMAWCKTLAWVVPVVG